MKPSEQLRAMADEMERRPWCRGEFTPGCKDDDEKASEILQRDPTAPCSGEGAALALGLSYSLGTALRFVHRVCGDWLSVYNDKIATCKEDEVQMLRKAAKLAESEGQ